MPPINGKQNSGRNSKPKPLPNSTRISRKDSEVNVGNNASPINSATKPKKPITVNKKIRISDAGKSISGTSTTNELDTTTNLTMTSGASKMREVPERTKMVYTNRKVMEFQQKMDQKETERKERLKEIKEKTAKTAEFRREKLLEDAKAVTLPP